MFGGGGMTITHREFCFDVNSESKYNPVRIPIQPGMPSLTRWLANIAPWFESYMFLSLEFEYVPSISTGRDGRLILGVDYDSNDSTPADIHVLENLGDNASGSVWAPLKLRCTNANLHKMVRERYVRTTDPKLHQDINTTDSGVFFLAIDGADAAHDGTKMGAMYVTYSIRLITPQVHTAASTNAVQQSYAGSASTYDFPTTSTNYPILTGSIVTSMNGISTNRWGDGSLLDGNSIVPLQDYGSGRGFKLPAGTWDLLIAVSTTYAAGGLTSAPVLDLKYGTSTGTAPVTTVQSTFYQNLSVNNICFRKFTFVVTDVMQAASAVFIPSYTTGNQSVTSVSLLHLEIHPHLADSGAYGAAVARHEQEEENFRNLLTRIRNSGLQRHSSGLEPTGTELSRTTTEGKQLSEEKKATGFFF
jgi:hypothetical protein